VAPVILGGVMVDLWPGPADLVVPEGIPAPSAAECAVYLLGPMRVRAGHPVEGGWRRKSLELLSYLAVHPYGVSRDQILEALWPGEDPRVTQRRLWHSAFYLRRRLRGAGVDGAIIHKIDDLYRLNFNTVWVDVRAFEVATLRSESASDPTSLLTFVCHLYKGEFCEGRYFGWGTSVSEGLRSRYIDASRTLAQLLERKGEREAALTVLDEAILFDPYDECLIRLAMKIEADLGRRDFLVRRFRRLKRLFLVDLDVDVSGQTEEFFVSLLRV
jgi:DNA-binding SARP family transcriptional activator